MKTLQAIHYTFLIRDKTTVSAKEFWNFETIYLTVLAITLVTIIITH